MYSFRIVSRVWWRHLFYLLLFSGPDFYPVIIHHNLCAFVFDDIPFCILLIQIANFASIPAAIEMMINDLKPSMSILPKFLCK